MKVAVISASFFPSVDGVSVALYHRAKVLSERGHQVLIACPDYQAIEAVYPNWREYQGEIFSGVQVVSLPSSPFLDGILDVGAEQNMNRQAARPLQQALADFAPDLIHVDEPDRIFLGLVKRPGLSYARAQGIPCLAFYHTNFIDYIEDYIEPGWRLRSQLISLLQSLSKLYMKFVFNAYDATLVGAPVTQQRLQQIGIQNMVCDRYLGVDLDAFTPALTEPDFFQSHYTCEVGPDDIVLTFLGRLTPDKGWRFTLRAFMDWVAQPENADLRDLVVLMIAGQGELQDAIEQGLTELGLRVCMLGQVPHDVVPALLTNSDIHVTASEKETLGLTILEAFAAGTPVIAPKAGGVVTLIREGDTGLLFRPGDVESFGEVLSRLVRNGAKRRRMGQNGKRSVEDYGQGAVVDNLLDTWQKYISD